jgi:hypothetical protein
MMEIKSKEGNFKDSLDEISIQMNEFTAELRACTMDILILNNQLLMLNDPVMNQKIEEMYSKYSNML